MMTLFTTAGNLITVNIADWHILNHKKDQTFIMFDLFYFKSIKFRRLSNEKEVLIAEVFSSLRI